MLIEYIMRNKTEILSIFEKHGAFNVKLIGSVARKQETENSDIDFVAELKRNHVNHIDLQAHSDLIQELQNYFDRKIDLADYDQIQVYYPNALTQGVLLNSNK